VAAQDAERKMERPIVPAEGAGRRDHMRTDGAAKAGFPAWPLIAMAGLGGFALITWLVASGVVFPFDQPLLDAARGLGQYMDAWRGLSESANLPLIAIGIAIVVWLLLARRGREALLVIGVLAAVTVGSEVIKQLVARPRPPGYDESTVGIVYSYPSGHVLEALTIYGIIAVLLWRSSAPTLIRVVVPIVFAAIIVLVAIARVAVGAHYPSDVLAGLLAGIGFVALFAWSSDILARRRASSSS
jgi:PAP2 superfamily.